ncbi:hypothetical protein [Allorhodopirellula solitaria]|uniref:Nucleotidyltransferase n=1 Tax=Allorhodopirellula solitaria TaxID=2527987 RepID=A0A5C5WY53_9BACT|nr:hypothetical protein [Allorhodopirellula solitaria]TWT55510.1 hypothetical protein CA85_49230 [Allorhodopirellula solitaria]
MAAGFDMPPKHETSVHETPEHESPDYLAERNAAMAAVTAGFVGVDQSDPKGPSGHAYGLRTSTRLTSDYRQRTGRGCVDVTPQEVVDCLRGAGVKKWMLMGLHGLVGYLPMPRATQDVDIMVPYSEKAKAAKAIASAWPMLTRVELSQVVRFLDPADLDPQGNPKPVIDLMLPWGEFQRMILDQHVIIDAETGNRLPTLEAVLASKYAALVSPHRSQEKKAYDAGDFRRVILANSADIDSEALSELGAHVWEKGGEEVLRFVKLCLDDQPLPI